MDQSEAVTPPCDLLLAASEGDSAALEKLQALTPEMQSWIREAYDLGRQTEAHLIGLIAGRDRLSAEGARQEAQEIRVEMAGPESSPLERLLSQRIACCWLHTHFLEIEVAKAMRGGDDDRANTYQRWLDRSHKRLLQAVKALAQTRQLLGPSLQANIAQKQLNVARW